MKRAWWLTLLLLLMPAHAPAADLYRLTSDNTRITVTLRNPTDGPLAFFNRVSLVDPTTKQRLLPVFYSDNYLSILPGETKTITLDYTPRPGAGTPLISVRGWNLEEQYYPVK